jgi:MFS family permease
MTLVGMGMLGFSSPFIFVPLLSEIIEAVREQENLPESPFLNDKASGIYNAAYGIGTFLAPQIGAILYGAEGFRYTCEIMAVCSLVLFICHFSFAIVIPIYIKRRKLMENL